MVTEFQNTQVLLLATVLLAACLAKLTVRERAAGVPDHVHGVPVPAGLARVTALRRSRGLNVGLGLGEGVLGLALLVTPQLPVRVAVALAFAAATWVVGELRVRRPDAGCGCFGGLSSKRVGRRSVLRAMLFTACAVASLGAPLPGLQVLRDVPAQVALLLTVELALFAALSPEVPALVERGARARGRGRPPVPCERRRSPVTETYRALYDSPAWVEHENVVASAVPLDVWREGCWRFVVFPARMNERDMEVVFAVSTAERDRTVRSAVVQADPADSADSADSAGSDVSATL
ncbi:MauE/DoxX family redox-associated membrane protein [Actinomadura roseirufa]|uniref:MauE/DoxX family redox-associated membrane protein n=1 Tax=Actinomadura roseirufa TaxID=2094049 RepID=UPI001040FD5A|nr:MauE/DoxX family redox-associated membrane protein [Actinomadura roseirufa]